MSSSAQLLSIFAAVFGVLFWIRVPELQPYSLQLVAALTLVYFWLKRTAKRARFHMFPQALTMETALFSAALLLAVGYTGGVSSILLPLLYFLLFLSLFILDTAALISMSLIIPFFLWAVTPPPLGLHALATLFSFPAILPLLLFARTQYKERKAEQKILDVRGGQKVDTAMFLTTFLQPKLRSVFQLSSYPVENQENIQKQLRVILDEAESLIEEVKEDDEDQ